MRDMLNKFVGMNAETRRNTITAFVVAVLDFLTAFNIIHFSEEQTQAIYKLVLVVTTAIVWAYCSHYKNNDYTEEACIGTGVTRQLKAEKEKNYVGDFFFTDDYVHEYEEESEEDRGSDPEELGEDDE